MTVVQADGNDVVPVTVDEFRISVAETYDVIVQPTADRAFTIFAQAEDRTGYARGTLAPRAGMAAAIRRWIRGRCAPWPIWAWAIWAAMAGMDARRDARHGSWRDAGHGNHGRRHGHGQRQPQLEGQVGVDNVAMMPT